MVLAGASLWGLSGSAAQFVFERGAADAGSLVSVRLLASGVILLLYVSMKNGFQHVCQIWKKKTDICSILVFSIFGMLAVQYTFFASIEKGNAAAAAILQYLAPFFVLFYLYVKKELPPKWKDAVLTLLALSGVFLLLTGGRPDSLYIPAEAAVWGVLSGGALAFYTVFAGGLIQSFGALTVTGWGMLVGGAGFSFLFPPFRFNLSHIGAGEAAAILFVVLCGTSFGVCTIHWQSLLSFRKRNELSELRRTACGRSVVGALAGCALQCLSRSRYGDGDHYGHHPFPQQRKKSSRFCQ